ncbi:MAG: hypothetical protein ABI165_08045 [Bryobacteraceae bacterium]
MLPNFVLPETVVRESGASAYLEIDGVASVLLTLGITRILEQESLQMSIWGSADGEDWGQIPLAAFPQKFYCGTYSLFVDLGGRPGVRYLRAQWEVNRWGRGDSPPLFGLYLFAEPATSPAIVGAYA